MRILYIHGAFSAFRRDSSKVQNLEKEFEVIGFNYSMECSFSENKAAISEFCVENKVDGIVGASLGGLYAAEVGKELSIPAILINPCVEPVMSLSTIVGTTSNYATGKDETLTQEQVNTYPKKTAITPLCLVFVGMMDTLIDPVRTSELSAGSYGVVYGHEADHYWDDFEQNKLIKEYLNEFERD